jgi:peptidyl-prolyl cis-trans isomerase SurA
MRRPSAITGPRRLRGSVAAQLLCWMLFFLGVSASLAQSGSSTASSEPASQPLDSVIAVVNNQVILASDLDLELRLFRLLPINDRRDSTPQRSLQRLITRNLIEQQVLQEDPHGLEVSDSDLKASLTELRQNLPACKQRDCTSPADWAAFLATLGLTPERVDAYWSNRMALLRFIEQRFRSGIRVAPEEIQTYYQETLLPQYAKVSDAPPLDRISPRIQEILLQQKVNVLLNEWLKSLQDQGQVEVLDPSLAEPTLNAAPPKPTTAPPQSTTAPPGNGGAL